ncbi:MAG: hypothetical protein ACJ761_03590 [Chloroflexota bacterium]
MSLRTYRICQTHPRRDATLMGIIRRTQIELDSAGRRARPISLPARRGVFA